MPTYEYECQKCGHVFEEFQKMTDEPLKECPECLGKVKRLIGVGGGVIYKGGGFYTTEYRSAEYRKKAKEESGNPSAASKKDSSKSTCSSCSASSCSSCKK